MKRKTERQKALARFLVSASYGGLLGLFLGLLTGNILVAVAGAWTGTVAVAWVWAVARSVPMAMVRSVAVVGFVAWVGSVAWAVAVGVPVFWAWTWACAWTGTVAVVWALKKIGESKNTSSEALIDDHIDWLMSLFQKFRLFIENHNHTKTSTSLHGRKRAWDVQLVESFAHELAAVFPEEWDEWQHWISDMMESRTRMQAKGMNHRLVSLITFHRISCFVWHIGIDKFFILATRRATR